MRVLAVVQRYGERVAGGAEALAREFSERLAGRGHEVAVLTSCATDYRTWEDDLPPGTTEERGVEVTRLPVVRPRDPARFAAMSSRVLGAARAPAPEVQRAWMIEQGPITAGFGPELRARAAQADVVAFYTYLYPPTVLGLPLVAGRCATVLHPTAHDEAPMRLPTIRRSFDLATGLAYSTPEEADLVRRRFRPRAVERVLGIGFDPPPTDLEPDRFRRAHGLGDDPYLLFLGRIDPNKGADDAIAHVLRYRRERRSSLRLVLMGMAAMALPDDPGLVVTGFVDDQVRWDAIAGAAALLQPSYQESFSMALAESWSAGRPGIVQERCDVLAGLARRSGGALPYRGYADFAAATDVLLDRPALSDALGASGRAHVERHFTWDAVMSEYETLLDETVEHHAALSRAAGGR